MSVRGGVMVTDKITDSCLPRRQDIMRVLICLTFVGVTCAALSSAPHIEVGLEQTLSMPEDSFVLKYFLVRLRYMYACMCVCV